MKSPGADRASIIPDANGWRIIPAPSSGDTFATIAAAVSALPLQLPLELALPCSAVLIERLRLPAIDRVELRGMLDLQLEKTLPYPSEEVSSDFDVVANTEAESVILSVASHTPPLDALCQPLREVDRLPSRITLYAMHVAARCPSGETVLAVFPEQGALILATCENRKLLWAHTVPGTDAQVLASELQPMLLGAEMEGVSTAYTRVLLARECVDLEATLQQQFGVPIEVVGFETPLAPAPINLLPASWVAEVRREERKETFKQRAMLALVLYLLMVAGAFAYLLWLKRQAQQFAREYAETKPQIEFVKTRQALWNALAPAVDPGRYTVEVLFLIYRNLPADEVRITEFNYSPGAWTVVGEAPTASSAIEFVQKLKAEKELDSYDIQAGQPKILEDDHAQFSITGKL